jgi:uncharacterized protein (TIGR03000 family)
MFAKQSIVSGVIAGAWLLLATQPASAQFGPGQQGPLANRDSGYSSYAPSRYQTYYYPPAAPAAYQSFYRGSQANGSVLIRMRVPENAQVWFDDRPTTRQGTERDFVSPPLSAGRYFTYRVRVQWMEGGRPVSEERNVTVSAGDRVDLSFGLTVSSSYYFAPSEGSGWTDTSEGTFRQRRRWLGGTSSWPSSDRTANPYYPR